MSHRGTTYYIDSAGGNDAATGTTPSTAWKSLDKIDATTFQPGDRILLKAGDEWTGQLWPKGSGIADSPITIGSYGRGHKPEIKGAGTVADAVHLWNQQYWVIRDLDVSNAAPSTGVPGENLGDFRGIRVGGDNGQQLNGFTIDDVDVHDVTGQVNWIGGGTSPGPGIHFGTGWDDSKNTGGIVFEPWVADPANPGTTATTLHDITVENSTVQNTSFGGIIFKQYTGSDPGAVPTGWGTRSGAVDPSFSPNTNIVVRNNYITQAGTPYGADGIYITGSRNAVIEDNVIDHAGTSGVESYNTDQVTVQSNEIFGTSVKAGGSDSNAIDSDINTTNQTVQYNYIADNGEGVLIYQGDFGTATYRYNVLVHNSIDGFHIFSGPDARGEIYGNTVYDTAGEPVLNTGGGYTAMDNIFYSTTGVGKTEQAQTTYDHNLYYGTSVPSSDPTPLVADPRFIDPTPVADITGVPRTHPDLALGLRYDVRGGSPAINMGAPVNDNGGRDFAGAPVYNGQPDIGAFEYHSKPGIGVVAGNIVESTQGLPVPGAMVRISGSRATARTGPDGWFALTGVPVQDGATLTVSDDGFTTATATVDVVSGNETTVPTTTLVARTPDGSVSGTVLNASAKPVSGAAVVVFAGGEPVGTTTSGADGGFTVPEVPAGGGYTVTASATGLTDATHTGVSVVAGLDTDAGVLGLTGGASHVIASHDFDALPTGPLADGTDSLAVSSTGGTVTVDDSPDGGHYLTIDRTAIVGSTGITQDLSPGLQGIITVDQDVLRDSATGDGYFGAPYMYNSYGGIIFAVGFNNGVINSYVGGSSENVGTYTAGTWTHVKAVIDTFTQTYDLYLNGTEVLQNAALRNPVDTLSAISDYMNGGWVGSIHIDNLEVAQGGAA